MIYLGKTDDFGEVSYARQGKILLLAMAHLMQV